MFLEFVFVDVLRPSGVIDTITIKPSRDDLRGRVIVSEADESVTSDGKIEVGAINIENAEACEVSTIRSRPRKFTQSGAQTQHDIHVDHEGLPGSTFVYYLVLPAGWGFTSPPTSVVRPSPGRNDGFRSRIVDCGAEGTSALEVRFVDYGGPPAHWISIKATAADRSEPGIASHFIHGERTERSALSVSLARATRPRAPDAPSTAQAVWDSLEIKPGGYGVSIDLKRVLDHFLGRS